MERAASTISLMAVCDHGGCGGKLKKTTKRASDTTEGLYSTVLFYMPSIIALDRRARQSFSMYLLVGEKRRRGRREKTGERVTNTRRTSHKNR